MCDLRPWRLGLPGWVPKSLVSPLHLKFSCRIWDTSSWHWIPLGSTSLTGSDTPSHSVTPLPPSHTYPASNHWGLCLYPRLQWPPVSHDHSSPSSLPFASETALGCLQSAFLCPKEDTFVAWSKGVSYTVFGKLEAACQPKSV